METVDVDRLSGIPIERKTIYRSSSCVLYIPDRSALILEPVADNILRHINEGNYRMGAKLGLGL
jgi:hypothetical protein